MEFPHLGKHCSEPSCKQLDFLPMKCDACSLIYCRDHIVYATHCCTESYKKNNKIPVCPLCNLPCPTKKGEVADVVVGKHIASDCMSDPAKGRRKVYTNKCSRKGCKKKELVPVRCESCRLNYCFHHRHVQDHDCRGFQASGKAVSNQGAAAILRAQQTEKTRQQTIAASSPSPAGNSNRKSENKRFDIGAFFSSIQGALNEEEALAMALQMSMTGDGGQDQDVADRMTDQEKDDVQLAATDQETSTSRQLTQQSVKV